MDNTLTTHRIVHAVVNKMADIDIEAVQAGNEYGGGSVGAAEDLVPPYLLITTVGSRRQLVHLDSGSKAWGRVSGFGSHSGRILSTTKGRLGWPAGESRLK